MMWIAECSLDERGRLTLPKSFLKANNLDKYTKVFIQTMYNTDNTVKLVFENKGGNNGCHEEDKKSDDV